MREMATIVKLFRPKPGTIRAIFASGEVREIELKRYARKDTVFEPLADPAYASKCRIVDDGDALRWPGGMDMSAGAILRMGKRVEIEQRPGEFLYLVQVAIKRPKKSVTTSNEKPFVMGTAKRAAPQITAKSPLRSSSPPGDSKSRPKIK